MTDILDEVLSDKNEESKVAYFKKALPIVLIITLAIIIGMLINDWRVTRQERYNNEMGDLLIKSLENLTTDPKLVLEGLGYLVDNAKNHMKDIAVLQLIGINISSKDTDNAISIMQNVINNSDYLDLTRSYAKMMWISIMIDSDNLSNDDKLKLESYFADFTKEDEVFYGSVNLLKALYYQDTDKQLSIKISNELLSSSKVTPIVKEEARALIANINNVSNNISK